MADPFAAMRFLAGEWRGEGEGKVLDRRSQADHSAASGRPAARHEDLMTFFAEGRQLKTLHLDNEEHVVRCLVAEVPSGAQEKGSRMGAFLLGWNGS